MKVMFDANAFDNAINCVHAIKEHLDTIDVFVTDIQIEEIASIPDAKIEKRIAVFDCLCDLRPKLIPHVFTFDRINFNHFSFVTEPKYMEILKKSGKNQNDALIAATAISEGCILVTDDKEMAKLTRDAGGEVISFKEFMDGLR